MPAQSYEEVAARLTEIAYRALLVHGLRRPFVEVELELWRQIRSELFENPIALPGQYA